MYMNFINTYYDIKKHFDFNFKFNLIMDRQYHTILPTHNNTSWPNCSDTSNPHPTPLSIYIRKILSSIQSLIFPNPYIKVQIFHPNFINKLRLGTSTLHNTILGVALIQTHISLPSSLFPTNFASFLFYSYFYSIQSFNFGSHISNFPLFSLPFYPLKPLAYQEIRIYHILIHPFKIQNQKLLPLGHNFINGNVVSIRMWVKATSCIARSTKNKNKCNFIS